MNKLETKPIKLAVKVKKPSEKAFRTHLFRGSIKDLINTVAHLRKVLKTKKDFEPSLLHFEDLFKKQKYIRYKKHLRGVSHHCGLGPSRRPLLTYKYIIEVLKNLKTDIGNLKEAKISRVIVNIDTAHKLGGVITKSHNRMYRKDGRKSYLTFFVNYQK